MTKLRTNTSLLAAFASLVVSGVLLTGQQPAGGPFTAEQASAGKAAYEARLRRLSRRRPQRFVSARG